MQRILEQWSVAPLDALYGALLKEQLSSHGSDTVEMCTSAPLPLSFACLGACRNGGYEPTHRLPASALGLRAAWRGAAGATASG